MYGQSRCAAQLKPGASVPLLPGSVYDEPVWCADTLLVGWFVDHCAVVRYRQKIVSSYVKICGCADTLSLGWCDWLFAGTARRLISAASRAL